MCMRVYYVCARVLLVYVIMYVRYACMYGMLYMCVCMYGLRMNVMDLCMFVMYVRVCIGVCVCNGFSVYVVFVVSMCL